MKRNIICAGAAISILTFLQAAQAEQRPLGPHEHGHGNLNIAIEGSSVQMELDVPGSDVVGFEHEATTPEQKAQIKDAEARLKDALKQFVMPAAAACKLAKAEVEVEVGAKHENEHGDDNKAHQEHGHEKSEHKDEHDEGVHDGGARHSEFKATYTLDCASPGQIKSVHFAYFKSFPNARSLSVKIVSEKQQGSYEVTTEKPDLDLTGSM